MTVVVAKKPGKRGFLRRHWFGLVFSVSFLTVFFFALMLVGNGAGGGEGVRGASSGPFTQFSRLMGSDALRIDTVLGVVGVSVFIGGFGLRDMLARRHMKRPATVPKRPEQMASG